MNTLLSIGPISLQSVFGVIIALLVFILFVFFHELGHFIFAKKAGIVVEEFAIGMGPRLIGKKIGETVYSINALPIGGYCKMLGEDEAVDNEGSFSSKTVWQRFQVIFGGPLFNFIMAFVFAAIIIAATGTISTVVTQVDEGTPAMEAGILPGDKVVGYNGRSIISYQELNIYMSQEQPTKLELTVKRKTDEGKTKKLTFTINTYKDDQGRIRTGIVFGDVVDTGNPLNVLKYAAIEVIFWVKIVIYSLSRLVTGAVSTNDISGPVGIIGAISTGYTESAKYGIEIVLLTMSKYIVVLSANLGFMNLLPIPALDGGRIILLLVEGIRGKPMDPKKEGYIHFVGFVLLMGLMVLVLFNDVLKIVR